MNAQYHITTTSPVLPASEELVDIPSEYITGNVKKRPTLNEFTLSDKSMKLLFKMFAAFSNIRHPEMPKIQIEASIIPTGMSTDLPSKWTGVYFTSPWSVITYGTIC